MRVKVILDRQWCFSYYFVLIRSFFAQCQVCLLSNGLPEVAMLLKHRFLLIFRVATYR